MKTLMRVCRSYASRLAVWVIVLVQVRGYRVVDEIKLLISALCAPVTSLQGLGSWQDPQLLFDAEVVIPDVGRFKLRRRTDDLWIVVPWRERAVVDVIRSLLHPGDTFVDAGANI